MAIRRQDIEGFIEASKQITSGEVQVMSFSPAWGHEKWSVTSKVDDTIDLAECWNHADAEFFARSHDVGPRIAELALYTTDALSEIRKSFAAIANIIGTAASNGEEIDLGNLMTELERLDTVAATSLSNMTGPGAEERE